VSESQSDRLLDDTWRAYEAAQKHHDSDLALFNSRTNLFLLVETALITIATAAVGRENSAISPGARVAITVFGILLSLLWLFAALSAYTWAKAIRHTMVCRGDEWTGLTRVRTSSLVFSKRGWNEVASAKTGVPRLAFSAFWLLRPTFVLCTIPLLYLAGWIVVAFL
jgi:hypothetical protein